MRAKYLGVLLALLAIILFSGCDPVDFRCKIINNTPDGYYYCRMRASDIMKYNPQNLFYENLHIKSGDTTTYVASFSMWYSKSELDTVEFFFLKESDFKNHTFKDILEQHKYIERLYTKRDMSDMNYIIKIAPNNSDSLYPH